MDSNTISFDRYESTGDTRYVLLFAGVRLCYQALDTLGIEPCRCGNVPNRPRSVSAAAGRNLFVKFEVGPEHLKRPPRVTRSRAAVRISLRQCLPDARRQAIVTLHCAPEFRHDSDCERRLE